MGKNILPKENPNFIRKHKTAQEIYIDSCGMDSLDGPTQCDEGTKTKFATSWHCVSLAPSKIFVRASPVT